MKFVALLPFFVELIFDYILIKKGEQDLPWWLRCILIGFTCWYIIPYEPQFLKSISMAMMPFCFFDPSLNIMRGLNLGYEGKTKAYDRWLSTWDSRFILFVRITLFLLLFVVYKIA